MLAVHAPGDLAAAVARGDRAALERVPGVGPKVAARLVLELSGKLPDAPSGGPAVAGDGRDQVAEALVSLGWNQRDARAAVEAVASTSIAAAEVPAVLREALQRIGGSRG
jgi:Holliday junction DNA helicase RuvA